jgi:hypothetical protein
MENIFWNDENEDNNNCLKKNDFEEDCIPEFYIKNVEELKEIIGLKNFTKYEFSQEENNMDIEDIPKPKINKIGLEKENKIKKLYLNINIDLDEDKSEKNNTFILRKVKKIMDKYPNLEKYNNKLSNLLKEHFLNKKRRIVF